jgi:hypothetical protein
MRAAAVAALVVVSLCAGAAAAVAKGRAMSPFERAKDSFRHEVAALYHLDPTSLQVAPDAEDISGYAEYKTGELYAFAATLQHKGKGEAQTVAGFASAAGEVVLEKRHNLAALLRQAQFLDGAKALPPKAMAERVLFFAREQLGTHNVLRESGRVGVAPSRIERRPDGSASLVFFYENLTGVEGMSLHSTPSLFRAELRAGKDEHAALTTALVPEEHTPTF